MNRIPALFVLLTAVAVGACSGGNSISPFNNSGIVSKGRAAHPLAIASVKSAKAPAPYEENGPIRATRDSTPQLNHPNGLYIPAAYRPTAPNVSRGRRTRQSVVGSDGDGGQAGTFIDGSTGTPPPYTGIYANQVLYISYSDSVGYLYAPTMKGPGVDCLEISTIYGSGTPSVGVWDFCASTQDGFAYAKDASTTEFSDTYLRNHGDGLPAYTAESKIGTDGYWHAYIYNYDTSSYEEMYNTSSDSSQGTTEFSGSGWDDFETHFGVDDTCPLVNSTASGGIRVRDASNTWYLVGSETGYTPQHSFEYGNCFNLDGNGDYDYTGPNPYVITWSDGNGGVGISNWLVTGGT